MKWQLGVGGLGLALLLGCGQAEATPTAVSPPPTVAVVATAVVEEATAVPEASETAVVEASPVPEATATEGTVAEEATPTVEPTAEATAVAEPTAEEVVDGEHFAPGQQTTVTLVEDSYIALPFVGTRFEPLLFFVNPADNVNVTLSVYAAEVEAGADLTVLTPLAQADLFGEGVPEMVVFTPNADGDYSLIVTAVGSGDAEVYNLDVRSTGEPSTLAAGEVRESQSFNNIDGPVVVFARPLPGVDISVKARRADGTLITEADFGGPGSAESLFVLPPQTTAFNFEVAEATGAAAEYYLFIMTPE